MRINSVYLENYRIHSEKFIEFEQGVNLLLGSNGKGKSSVLEAIGITLFASSFRDGNTNGQKQCIKYGENSALVKIEFVGNDGECYIVENQLKKSGSGFNKLYRKDDSDNKLTSKEEITEKLKTLVGISGELKDIYENIIVAKQNEFINGYKLKPSDRQKMFDRIFNTDIYRNIHDGHSKKALDKYQNEVQKEKSFLEGLSQNIEDIGVLNIELGQNNEEIIIKSKEKELNLILEKEIKGKIQEINDLNNKFNINKNELINLEKLLKSKEEESQKNIVEIDKADKALTLINENRASYLKYKELESEEVELNKICNDLENKTKEFTANESKQKDIEKEIEVIKGKISGSKIRISNEEKQKKEVLEVLENLQNERIEKELKFDELEKNISETDKTLKECNVFIAEMEEAKNNYDKAKFSFDKDMIELKEKEDSFDKNREIEIEKELEKLQKAEEEKKLRQNELSSAEARLKDNFEAMKTLQSSICPFLKETCKNLDGKDVTEFFRGNENNLKSQIQNLSEDIKVFENGLKVVKELQKEQNFIKNIINEISKKKIILEKEILQVQLFKQKFENKNLVLQNFVEKNGNKENLQNVLSNFKAQKSVLKMEETIKNIDEKNNLLKKIIKEVEIYTKETALYEEKEKGLELNIENISSLLESLKEFPSKYIYEKEKLNQLKDEKDKLSLAYKLFVSNEKIAENLDKLKSIKDEIQNKILEIDSEFKNKKTEKESLESVIAGKENQEVLKSKEAEIKTSLDEINKALGKLENSINQINERIKKNLRDKLVIEEKEKLILKLNKKVELTKIFRENIKDMGTKVSQGMLNEISFWATDNFRKITGRVEQIEWSNLVNPYEVSLVGGQSKITFEQLSGGEQVAVAIAIRGAMSNMFTKTKFSIFDEPTNNLDVEKRKSLADNIGEILKDLDQSIVVTHDDTFREMAQKVIEI